MFKLKSKKLLLSVLLCICTALFACGIFTNFTGAKDKGQTVTAHALTEITPTVYWGLDADGVLTLSTSEVGGTKSGSFAGNTVFSWNGWPWYVGGLTASVTSVVVAEPIKLANVAWMFYCLTSVKTIDVSKLDTSDVTSMEGMFGALSSVESIIGLENFVTDKVTKMGQMFVSCVALQELNVSSFNTSQVTDMNNMFANCICLEKLDLSGFDCSKVTSFGYMLQCQSDKRECELTLNDTIVPIANKAESHFYDRAWYDANGNKYTASNKITAAGTYTDYVPCDHVWVESRVLKEKTCTEDGIQEFVCSKSGCKKTKTEPIPAEGHSYGNEWKSGENGHWKVCTVCQTTYEEGNHTGGTATCQQKATCSVCGREYGELGDHDIVHHAAQAATCKAVGWEAYDTCKNCSYSTYKEIAKAEHTPGEWIVDSNASCEVAGSRHKECTVCNVTLETESVPATGHGYSEDWETDGDNHWHVCSKNCGIKGSLALHTWGEPTVIKQPTEKEEGSQTVKCTVCEYEKTETLPVAGNAHTFAEEWSYDEDNHWHAATCGHDAKDSLGLHSWDEGVITTPASCIAAGEKTFTCTVCKKTRTEVIAKLDHEIEHHGAQAETCTEKGWKAYDTCKNCDYTTYIEISAMGHNYEAMEGSVAPTCTEPGSGKIKCTRCGDEKEGDVIPALGHNSVVDEAVAPTCTDTGLTAGAHCSVCGEVLTAQEEVPATGHSHEWVITKQPTVNETGLMKNICSVCGDIDGEKEIAELTDPDGNGEIDLPIDIADSNVEFKITQSSTGNDYSNIEKGLKRGYWAQLWYRNDDGTLGDEFTDKINCFLTLKIPTDIIEAIRGGEEINRDKIAAGLKVYYIDGDGLPVEVDNFTIAMRDDDSWQIKFNYNEKFRAEVVFAADLAEQPAPEPESGIPWWVWLIVGIGIVVVITLIIVIAIAVKNKKNGGGTPGDNGEVIQRLDNQDQILNELLTRGDDGGFNTPVELDENGNVIFK